MGTINMNDSTDTAISIGIILVLIMVVVLSIFGLMGIYAKYNVWSSGLAGQAQLAQAEYSRQIAVREAQAKMDSAKLLAQAEIERSKGVAEANKIIGDSLKDNEGYLRYLWIDGMQHTSNQVIYIPTETNLPILEAMRNKK